MQTKEDVDRNIVEELSLDLLPEEIRRDVTKKIKEIAGYRPTIALLGKTGAGKSSLGNSLFGREVFPVSSVRAGTRAPNPLSTIIAGVDMTLVDFPGVGESRDRDEEYRKLYSEWIDRIDVALWVIKMDDRVLAPDIDYLENVLKPANFPLNQIVFVVSQADKADPLREWDTAKAMPSMKQQTNIDDRISQLSETFQVNVSQIVAVSAEERYNLKQLAKRIVSACPAKAALNVARSLEQDLKTDEVRQTVLGKVWSAVSTFYTKHDEQIHQVVLSVISLFFRKKIRLPFV